MTTISRDDMAAHIAAGHATPWTQTLGADHQIPVMARLGDTWYVVPDGHDDYHLAPPDLAADLTRIETVLAIADRTTADTARQE